VQEKTLVILKQSTLQRVLVGEIIHNINFQENFIHVSDSQKTAIVELNRFFNPEEIVDYRQVSFNYFYTCDETLKT
jgi:nucleoside diphosphate kinase